MTGNRQGFVDDDNDVELLINDEDGVGCCPFDEDIPDELWFTKCFYNKVKLNFWKKNDMIYFWLTINSKSFS